jgi:hypothetical protein
MKSLFLSLITLLVISSCSKRSDSIAKPEVKDSTRDEHVRVQESFEMSNYLRIYKLISGPIFQGSSGDSFFRIVEIPSEEHLIVYIEKIEMKGESSGYSLLDRYKLEELSLGLRNPAIFAVDSLKFTDSVAVVGYFNRTKLIIDLNAKSVRQ